MSKTERIGERLPKFYKVWDENTVLHHIISSFAAQLEEAEGQITELMRARWVDSAAGADLNRVGSMVSSRRMEGEDDERYRGRIRRAVSDYRGGGTILAILESVRGLIGSTSETDIEILENPPKKFSEEYRVMAGDTWIIGSRSITDEEPTITIRVDGEGEIRDPVLTNLKTGDFIRFSGTLGPGQELVVANGRVMVDGEDASGKLESKGQPKILREGSRWRYSETLSGLLGVFDSARFDEHTFTKGIPFVRIRFDWTGRVPAAFEVRIREGALRKSGLSAEGVENFVGRIKAAGVSSAVKVIR